MIELRHISDQEIEKAKARTDYSIDPLHRDNDSIRVAYQWLDAQVKTKKPTKAIFCIKQRVKAWSGIYISMSDVEVAAELHPDIHGKYPRYNIDARLILPSHIRVNVIDDDEKIETDHMIYGTVNQYRRIEKDCGVIIGVKRKDNRTILEKIKMDMSLQLK